MEQPRNEIHQIEERAAKYEEFVRLADGRYIKFSDMGLYATKRDLMRAIRMIILVKALFLSICVIGVLVYAG